MHISIYSDTGNVRKRLLAGVMFVLWLGIVCFLSWTHLVWRDEVRALSLALQGDNLFAMLKGLHGEGHPAIWYLLLRTGHALIPHPGILLVVSILVAAFAMLLLVLRAPFSLPFLALVLLTRFSAYEYSVMARNYGISMLVLFLFAVFYERHRDRGCLLGVLLFLLANCNVPSVMLAGGLLLFWFVDLYWGDPEDKPENFRVFVYNAALAFVGVLVSYKTVYPTFNDSMLSDHSTITMVNLVKGVLFPSVQFLESCQYPGAEWLSAVEPILAKTIAIIVMSVVMYGCTLGLVRRTGAFLAALVTLLGFSLYFVIIYPGGYRHQALWLAFMTCMYWLAAPRNTLNDKAPDSLPNSSLDRLRKVGTVFFVLLLLLQVPYSVDKIVGTLIAPVAALDNRNQNIRSILAGHSELAQSVVIADPDFLLETLPYYVSNPTYLMREQRYGNVVHFTRKARLKLDLGDVLANARQLLQQTGRPVVILLSKAPDPSQPFQEYQESFNWDFVSTADQARDFLASTRLLEHHPAPAGIDEGYYVYVMDK